MNNNNNNKEEVGSPFSGLMAGGGGSQAQSSSAGGPEEDVQRLRRLTRDAFGEITALRDRVRDMERNTAQERERNAAERVLVMSRLDVGACTGGDSSGGAGPLGSIRQGIEAITTVEVGGGGRGKARG